MGVQTLRTERAIERFNECIVRWLARPGKVERNTLLVSPQIEVLEPQELRERVIELLERTTALYSPHHE